MANHILLKVTTSLRYVGFKFEGGIVLILMMPSYRSLLHLLTSNSHSLYDFFSLLWIFQIANFRCRKIHYM